MDITLANFNLYYVKYLDGKIVRQSQLPLGPLYLMSALTIAGFRVDFRDYQHAMGDDIFSRESLVNFLTDPAPVIGLSCMANMLPLILWAAPLIKEQYPDRIVVLGGVGAMGIEREILERVPGIDIIHRGEAEISGPLLLKALRTGNDLDSVPGIFYRRDGRIIQNPPPPRLMDLDHSPRPAYDAVDFSAYAGYNMLGSRGCPYPCTFCSLTPIWGRKPVLRSNQNIVSEMAYLHREYGVRQFLFQDEYFAASPERLIDFAERVRKERMDISYKAFARVDQVNDDALRALADSGCREIRFGVESGSDRVLALVKKGFDSNTALEQVSRAKKCIPQVDTFFIWGFPFETLDDFNDSVFQMIAFRGMGVRVLPSLLAYLPQSAIYADLPDKSRLEFCEYLLPEYMIIGIEDRLSVRISVDRRHAPLFDFIIQNSDLFPGFFQYDIENNILPKLALLEEFEFYRKQDAQCGAHLASEPGAGLTLRADADQ